MPQPLSRVKKDAVVEFSHKHPGALLRYPHIAALAMECIASWSAVEMNFLRLYFAMLKGADDSAITAVDAYMALESQSAKTAAILAVARGGLHGKEGVLYSIIIALQKLSKPLQKQRDKLAHHVLGASPDVPNCLISADQKVLAYKHQPVSSFYVWRERELKQIAKANYDAAEIALRFRDILIKNRTEDVPELNALIDELNAKPGLQGTLDHLVLPRKSRRAKPSP